jgi:hypothetical protein
MRTIEPRWISESLEINAMKTYEFSLVLSALKITEVDCDALYEAGCDDGTVVTRGGITHVAFDRQAESLEAAIRSAITQVRAAGFTVAHVEMDAKRVAYLVDVGKWYSLAVAEEKP